VSFSVHAVLASPYVLRFFLRFLLLSLARANPRASAGGDGLRQRRPTDTPTTAGSAPLSSSGSGSGKSGGMRLGAFDSALQGGSIALTPLHLVLLCALLFLLGRLSVRLL
jgi:hypothetical protein